MFEIKEPAGPPLLLPPPDDVLDCLVDDHPGMTEPVRWSEHPTACWPICSSLSSTVRVSGRLLVCHGPVKVVTNCRHPSLAWMEWFSLSMSDRPW